MASTEFYPDGSSITRFVKAPNAVALAEKMGKLSSDAFFRGADCVEQKVFHGNQECPMCDSQIRFDLCCGARANV